MGQCSSWPPQLKFGHFIRGRWRDHAGRASHKKPGYSLGTPSKVVKPRARPRTSRGFIFMGAFDSERLSALEAAGRNVPALPGGTEVPRRWRPAPCREVANGHKKEKARNRKALFGLFGLNPPQRESPAPAPDCTHFRAVSVRLQHKMLCCSIISGTNRTAPFLSPQTSLSLLFIVARRSQRRAKCRSHEQSK